MSDELDTELTDEPGVDAPGTTRRRFVQAAAAAGAVGLVWSEPIIRGTAAGAATGVSVNGKCTTAFIVWSNDANNWMASNRGTDITMDFTNASASSDNGGTFGTAVGTYTWSPGNTACATLTADVTITASSTPEATTALTGCTVTITSGVSCSFANVVTTTQAAPGVSGTGGSVDAMAGDTTFMWWNAPVSGTNPLITFDIVC